MTKEITPRGMRIIRGQEATEMRRAADALATMASAAGFEEVILPTVDFAETYRAKLSPELYEQMYLFDDKKGRKLVLRPEGTATIQQMYNSRERDVAVFYVARCYRYERPQAGRYREFTQFGVEILNPTDPEAARTKLLELAEAMVRAVAPSAVYEINDSARRGMSYYEGAGFEISVPVLGTQCQVVGGGPYKEGIGFAIGVERLLLANGNTP